MKFLLFVLLCLAPLKVQFSPSSTNDTCPKSQHCRCYQLHTNNLNDNGSSITTSSFGVECSFDRKIIYSDLPRSTFLNLHLRNCRINEINRTVFQKNRFSKLELIEISDDSHLIAIRKKSFHQLKNLGKIHLINLSRLSYISNSAFSSLHNLEEILIFNTALKNLQGLNGIDKARPDIFKISIQSNKYLDKIPSKSFSQFIDHFSVSFKNNSALKSVENLAFASTYVGKIDLSFNKNLYLLEEKAFGGMRSSLSFQSHYTKLTTLSITSTSVERLPTIGLEHLVRLEANDTPNLVMFPHADQLPALKEAFLTYSYHCCALTRKYGFGQLFIQEKIEKKKLVECETGNDKQISLNVDYYNDDYDYLNLDGSLRTYNDPEAINLIYSDMRITVPDSQIFIDKLNSDWIEAQNETSTSSTNIFDAVVFRPPFSKPGTIRKLCEVTERGIESQPSVYHSPIVCSPQPNLLNPCEDVLGNMKLNALSWIIALFAFVGNFVVIFVSSVAWYDRLFKKSKLPSVSSFLILNLALADFSMAIYMLMLSVMSTTTTGRYYQYGVRWQRLGGCDVAGFLSVFSLELSTFTLSVVSAERWYAIKNAINLEKRLSLKRCTFIMMFGWLLSILLATLPVLGINTYKKTAICLPIATESQSDRVYIGVILFFYIIKFLIIVMSYWLMWTDVRIRNQTCFASLKRCFHNFQRRFVLRAHLEKKSNCSSTSSIRLMTNLQKSDSRIAKRMAVLVFTNFISFFPICLFVIFGFVGIPLVSMSTTKAFLVFFFPLNSCCNPFIYALLTKSFRKDLRKILLRMKCCIKLKDIICQRQSKISNFGSFNTFRKLGFNQSYRKNLSSNQSSSFKKRLSQNKDLTLKSSLHLFNVKDFNHHGNL